MPPNLDKRSPCSITADFIKSCQSALTAASIFTEWPNKILRSPLNNDLLSMSFNRNIYMDVLFVMLNFK